MSDSKVAKMPYPKTVEAAAKLAVESAFQKLGDAGAFAESGGLSKSAMLFGEACAIEALTQMTQAAHEYATRHQPEGE